MQHSGRALHALAHAANNLSLVVADAYHNGRNALALISVIFYFCASFTRLTAIIVLLLRVALLLIFIARTRSQSFRSWRINASCVISCPWSFAHAPHIESTLRLFSRKLRFLLHRKYAMEWLSPSPDRLPVRRSVVLSLRPPPMEAVVMVSICMF
jgi:hypothetical protein